MQHKADTRMAQLAQIHIAKKDLGLDDETYRAMLWTCARVHSSADLDHAGRAKVLDYLKSRGWKQARTKPEVANIKKPLIAKIAAMLSEMDLTWAYADGIARQMYKRDKVQWCNPSELRGIVTALVKKQKGQHG